MFLRLLFLYQLLFLFLVPFGNYLFLLYKNLRLPWRQCDFFLLYVYVFSLVLVDLFPEDGTFFSPVSFIILSCSCTSCVRYFPFYFLYSCRLRHRNRGAVVPIPGPAPVAAPAPITTTYPCASCSTYRSICDRYIVRLSGYNTAYNNIRRAVSSLPGYDPSRSVRDNIVLFGSEYNRMDRCFSRRTRDTNSRYRSRSV